MGRRWGKIEKDFCTKNKTFDISKIPDIYDCIKYDLQHNPHTLQFEQAEELYITAKYLADIVIPQVCLLFTTFVSSKLEKLAEIGSFFYMYWCQIYSHFFSFPLLCLS
jgi:hypothetical protein